jgi:hypothetical protein
VLLGVLALPPLTRGLAVGHRATCKTNLQQLGAALVARATADPDGRFPDALADLVRDGQARPDVLVCPAHADADPAPAALSAAEQADRVAAGRHVTYAYLGKGWSASRPAARARGAAAGRVGPAARPAAAAGGPARTR